MNQTKAGCRIWRGPELDGIQEPFQVLETTPRTQFASMTLGPGEVSGEFGNEHAGSDQWLIVLDGTGEVASSRGAEKIGKGDVVLIRAPEPHQFKATGASPLRTITFYGPVAYPDD